MLVFVTMTLLAKAFQSFRSGEPWLDTSGNVIDAHGGGMLHENGTYYWYGSARNGAPCCHDRGINLYSSRDLYNWRFEGVARHSGWGTR